MKYHFRISHASDGHPDGEFQIRCLEISECTKRIAQPEQAAVEASKLLHEYLAKPPLLMCFLTPHEQPFEELKFLYGQGAHDVIAVAVKPRMAFALMLRIEREHRCFNQTEAAKLLGLSCQSAYQRLEDPLRANPTLATIENLLEIFPNFEFAKIFESAARPALPKTRTPDAKLQRISFESQRNTSL